MTAADRPDSLDDAAWLQQRYAHDNASQHQIAAELGVDQSAVSRAMRRHGIPTRGTGRRPVPVLATRLLPAALGPGTVADILDNPDRLRALLDSHPSASAAARALAVSAGVVAAAAARHGLPLPDRRPWAARVGETVLRAEHAAGRTPAEIGAAHGADPDTARQALIALGLRARQPSRKTRADAVDDTVLAHLADHGASLGRIARLSGLAVNTAEVRLELLGRGRRVLPAPLDDPAWLTDRLARTTGLAVAAELGVPIHHVRVAAARHGLPLPGNAHTRNAALNDPVILAALAADAPTLTALAAQLGTTDRTVRQALARHSIDRPGPPRPPRADAPLLDDKTWLTERYVHDRMSLRQIAAAAGAPSKERVADALRRHGIAARPPGRSPHRG